MLACLVTLTLCTGCRGVAYIEVPAGGYRYQSSEPSYTLQGFTPDGVAIMGWTTYSGQNTKCVQSGLVPTSSYNVCGPTTVPGPIVGLGSVTIGGWGGDQFNNNRGNGGSGGIYMGGKGKNPYNPGAVTGNHKGW